PTTTVTNAQGDYRFLNLSPGTYSLSHALSGFSTLKRDNILVEVGRNTELTVQMKLSGVTTEMVVTGESPLLDTRKTTTGANITQAELTSIPTGRDPWVILQSVPGVLVDRVNVGGSERLWLWGSYGRNQINLRVISGAPDRTTLEDINAKLNAQIVDNNSATVFFLRGDKIKLGRNASPQRPPETTWDQSGPTQLYK